MGVETIYRPKSLLIISLLFIFIISCAPVNYSNKQEIYIEKDKSTKNEVINEPTRKNKVKNISNIKKNQNLFDYDIKKNITILVSKKNNKKIINQFINVIELGVYEKNLSKITFDIKVYKNEEELNSILLKDVVSGKIFIGPINNNDTKIVLNYCDQGAIFFSFASNSNLAKKCVYLINFFPRNELEQIFLSINTDSRVALLYPENEYGYMINSLIDSVINKTDAILVNRASYKNDLSNVRDAIKELGKYELRKYELERQKQILYSKNDQVSKNRLKKLEKFKTTSDYEFTHILIADYGLNLLQVAPLLPYYDIDPNIVQFVGTGVIDDENFFIEPSLQGTIFPGVEINKRMDLINKYQKIYDENLMRISTLPYDLLGLLNFIYSRNFTVKETIELLNSSTIKFEGVDGEFYFKESKIERDLDILRISEGVAKKIN